MTTERGRPKDIIQQSILDEYPLLNGSQLSVKKRFQSSDGSRFCNTYLVESHRKGFEKFVVKSSANAKFRQKELGTEWRALNLLQSQPDLSPALLVPEHVPQTFLLLEYIEGRTAAETVLSEQDRDETFYQAGKAAGKIHSIAVPSFGSLSSPSNTDWKSYFDGNTEGRFSDLSGVLPDELSLKLQDLYESSAHLLEEDSPESPVLVQRDMHFDNFIIRADSGKAVLIDFAYAAGGRPLSDLGRLYVQDFYKFPDCKDKFFRGYQQCITLPDNFNELMKLYTMSTALGMVYMANAVGRKHDQEHPTAVLSDLANGTGLITELLQS